MGCVVNGPGESKHANIGISLPGTFEEPKAPVYVDGRLFTTLKGDRIVAEFIEILDEYVDSHYAARESGVEEPVVRSPHHASPSCRRDVARNVFLTIFRDAGCRDVASYVSTAGLFLPVIIVPSAGRWGLAAEPAAPQSRNR